jgi:hypothetical protein
MKLTRSALLLALVATCGLLASTAAGQTASGRQTATVTANAPTYILGAVSPTPLRVAARQRQSRSG